MYNVHVKQMTIWMWYNSKRLSCDSLLISRDIYSKNVLWYPSKATGLYNNRIIEYINIIILLGELYTFLFIKLKKEPSHSPFVLDCL